MLVSVKTYEILPPITPPLLRRSLQWCFLIQVRASLAYSALIRKRRSSPASVGVTSLRSARIRSAQVHFLPPSSWSILQFSTKRAHSSFVRARSSLILSSTSLQ